MVHYYNAYRPDNLLTNFIAWRGILTKMLCTMYNHQEPWKVAATLYKGTIYLQEIETEEKRQQEAAMPEHQRATCYWGLKFEDYVTSKGMYIILPYFMLLYSVCGKSNVNPLTN